MTIVKARLSTDSGVSHYERAFYFDVFLLVLTSRTAKKEAAVSICNLQLVVMWLINVPFYVLY
jgi:hypothetical protein